MLYIRYFQSKWITHVQTILSNVGRPDIFQHLNNHHQGSTKYLLHTIKKTLIDQYSQTWHTKLQNSSKDINYSLFKDRIQIFT